MADHQPVKITAEQIQRADQDWQSFTVFGKWSVVVTAAVLILLALIFIR